ncbi:restriction endonuclease subunit M [Tenacibaculum todarodis]|uniref:site-specific DNA-methyltransferase (adenine-specific) n=1 Tax=Tenacibaculum todarodis TaxID=1850252 RepID=A0A1L3JJ13_9FLAO|nr:N-6 DNA methylase [Tenacibaculum todarodis]APG65082.1 restriction endonuclease subunit M [Tenacibaculum todarodis]
MSLFQTSVLKGYLNQQNKEQVNKAYKKYVTYFLNPTIQENIRSSKEEEYQGIFLTELFVNILDYTLKPKADFNLVAEYKNQTNARKADGAILHKDIAIGVIELKGTNTKDLESIRKQAFDYKANQKGCVYVITSNFEKLRFYINDATEFEEFNLFELTPERFELFYLCLQKDNIINNAPLKIKEASIVEEQQITKGFYKDYSLFKRELYRDLVKQNAKSLKTKFATTATLSENETKALEKNVKLTLFKKSQKLIDRFLFIFFAEDRSLLPANSTELILERWKKDYDYGDVRPLYNFFKLYFNFLDKGRQAQGGNAEIYAYNGGLFKEDALLDALEIDNELLYRHTHKLAAYDFESQVDVNILGHIFENSLNEIESVNAEIEGSDFDKQTSKRKKDGVFYTPKYITKYIVENTIGKLCTEKKIELGFKEEEYFRGRKKRHKDTITNLVLILDTYREWLLQLTICDPACGSGAFLNQALDFLIKEHNYIDELKTKVLGGGLQFSDIENTILENNIFGVDLNEESVEIAKLSLWLRTAQPRRKLNDLSSNIKCGNSLIDSKTVAGDKAFSWEENFPQVFENGGFDVIIGNPPYLRVQGLRENFERESIFYEKTFKSATGRFDVYVLFMEKSFDLINDDGIVSFILPHKFLVSDFGTGIRQFFVDNKSVESILTFGSEMVFSDASTYTCIINLAHSNSVIKFKDVKPIDILNPFDFEISSYDSLSKEKWNLKSKTIEKLFRKLNTNPWTVKDVFKNISQGVVSVGDDIFLMKGIIKGDKFIGFSDKINGEIILEANIVKPLLKGENVKKYASLNNDYFCLYPHSEKEGKTIPLDEEYLKENYPLAYNYMLPFKEELIEKKVRYKTNPKAWYSLHRSREISLFEQEKIVTPETSLGGNLTIDSFGYYHNTQVYTLEKNKNIVLDNKFWLAILNSSVFWYYLQQTGAVLRGGYFRFKTKYLEPFPLPKLKNIESQIPFIEKVDLMLSETKNFQLIDNKFQNYLKQKFSLEKLSKKLQNWHELEFGDFIKELNKAIKATNKQRQKDAIIDLGEPEGALKECTPYEIIPTLTKKDEFEWLDLFEENKQKAQELQTQINQTDKEIDAMVYELYGLTEEEIAIVENS